jgi:hypothetical protein
MPDLKPPPLPAHSTGPSLLANLLSLALALFLAVGVLGFLDDSLLLMDRRELSGFRALMVLLMLPAGVLLYLMIALCPRIPKKTFIPVALFIPVTSVAVLPLLVYFHEWFLWIGWAVSLIHVLLGIALIRRHRRGGNIRWPFIDDPQLTGQGFRWTHFGAVAGAGALAIVPALVGGVLASATLAVDHFSAGFVALKPSGISMQVRTYVRDDGRSVLLVPMSHVGEPDFYQNLAASFPDDAVVLMEGVSDERKLFTPTRGYSKMAEAIGVVEQQQAFKPKGRLVAADVDMSEFSPATIELLKNAMLIHSKGITEETMPLLMKPTPKGLEKQLMDDILTKRNQHVLRVLHDHLPHAEQIVVPWGAAHMPGIAREIERSGFRLGETRDYLAIRFGS